MTDTNPSILILGIDPSTTKCGVAVVAVPLQGQARLLQAVCIHGGKGDHLQRIRLIASEIATLSGMAEIIAIEEPFSRPGQSGPRGAGGGKNLEMVERLIGAIVYLSDPTPLELIHPATVAAHFGASGRPREEKKQMAVNWARLAFGLALSWADHDVAEAIAVACVGGERWRERKHLEIERERQPSLKLTGKARGIRSTTLP